MTRMTRPDCAVMCNLTRTYDKHESYGKVQGSAGEGRHGICGMPEGLARRHDEGPPVERNLRQEPGVA